MTRKKHFCFAGVGLDSDCDCHDYDNFQNRYDDLNPRYRIQTEKFTEDDGMRV